MNKFVIDSNDADIKIVTDKIKLDNYKAHNKEQIVFRVFCCKSCFQNKKCNNCNCNPIDKVVEPTSCNSKMYPNILNEEKWEKFKKEHNIQII